MTVVGELTFWAALVLAAWGVGAGAIAWRAAATAEADLTTSAYRAVLAAALLLALALSGVAAALFAPDPSYRIAALTTSANLPSAFRLAALMSRGSGSLLALAAATAGFGALAAAVTPRDALRPMPPAAFPAVLNALILVPLALLPLAGYPFARMAAVPVEGLGLPPDWQNGWTPLARALLVLAGGAAAVALAHGIARRAGRSWWLMAWTLGALALASALRGELAGGAWTWLEWAALAAWLAASVLLHRRATSAASAPSAARWTQRVVHAGAVLSLVGLAGLAMRAEHRVNLASGGTTELRDPLGARWTLTSEGASNYQELNRRVLAVLLEVRRETGRTRPARVEWRQYLDGRDVPLSDAPVGSVLGGATMGVIVSFISPPLGEDAELRLRFAPFLVLLWIGAGVMAAAGAAAAWRARAA